MISLLQVPRRLTRLFLFVLLWLVGLSTASLAQPKNKAVDSLQTLLSNHPQADTTRVKLLLELSRAYDYDSKLLRQVANEALGLSRQLGFETAQAEALLQLGSVYKLEGDLPRALAYFNQALKMPALKQNLRLQGRAFNLISQVYTTQGDYSQALQYLLQGLKASEQAGDQKEAAMIVNSFGRIYSLLGDQPQSLAYYFRSLKANEQLGDKNGIVRSLNNIGDTYRVMGNYPRAIHFFQEALTRAPGLNNNLIVGIAKGNLADVYVKQGLYGKALTLGRQALAMAQVIDDLEGVAACSEILARAHLHTGQLDSARLYGLRSLQVARQTGLKVYIRDAGLVLSQVYAKANDYPNAYRYQQLFTTYKDSLASEDTRNRANKLQFQYEIDKKEASIALLQKDKTLQAETARRQRLLLFAFVIGLALVGLLAVVLWRSNRNKQQANTLLTRQKQEIDQQALHLQTLNQELSVQNHQVAAQRDELGTTLTQLRLAQTQLIQQAKLASLGELTAGIAHEILNPLNFVNNFSEVSTELVSELKEQLDQGDIMEAKAMADDLAQNLQKITHHGNRASVIVKGMQAHARTETGEKRLADLNSLADEYLKIAYQALLVKDKDFTVELIRDFEPEVGKVDVVPQDLGRVLLNLYNNAFYAVRQKHRTAPPGYRPTVSINTARVNGHVEIRVSDNGTGMAESVKGKIFQPFFTTKPTGEGTGLGLSLSYDIVTKGHNGSLLVQSRDGQGTDFVIQLPTARE